MGRDGTESGRGRWRFRALLVGLVLCRGLMLMCILPPLEGWDEYQHVGYVAHVDQTGRAAVLGQTVVPREILRAAVARPQPKHALEQVARFGAVGYAEYWGRRDAGLPAPGMPAGTAGSIDLYQAQHGPLYYRLAAPLFRAAGGAADIARSVAALRLANLLLTAAAVGIALAVVDRLVADRRQAALIGILIALQPMLLHNGVRVANDALGVLLATAAIAGALGLAGRNLVGRGAWVGVLTGLAILAKAVHFGLAPFVAGCWALAAWRDRVPKARAALAALAIAAGALAVSQGELRSNLARFGSPTPMQEAVKNRREGKTAADLAATARTMGLGRKMAGLWSEGTLLIGGWSFQLPHRKLVHWYRDGLALGLLGWLFLAAAPTRPRPAVVKAPYVPVACVLLCLGYSVGLAYHMVQSQLAWGTPTTNPWYAAAAFPWLVLLVAAGGLSWPLGPFRPLLPALWGATFVAAEATVTWGLMVPAYSGGASGLEALRRLATFQTPLLGTATLVASTAGALALLAAAIVVGWLRPVAAPAPTRQKMVPHRPSPTRTTRQPV